MRDAELLLCVDSAADSIVEGWSSADALVGKTAVELLGVVHGASMMGTPMDMDMEYESPSESKNRNARSSSSSYKMLKSTRAKKCCMSLCKIILRMVASTNSTHQLFFLILIGNLDGTNATT
jgi:hypothetical protein